MNISIVSGAGFLGQSLSAYYKKKKYNVKLIDSKLRFAKIKNFNKRLNTRFTDYTNDSSIESALEKTDVLINLFSKTEPISSMKSIVHDAEINIQTNIRIFEISKKIGVKKIIFSSSGGAVYGNATKYPIKEDEITNPISAYGVSKISSEKYLNLYKNINTISLRTPNAYGPLQFYRTNIGIISKILQSIKESKEITIYGDGSIIKDFIYIDDVCSAFFKATISNNLKSDSYNIGSGSGITINKLINLIFEITKTKCQINYKDKRYFDVSKNILDYSKFTKLTKWKPEINLQKGIRLMWEYLNNNK